MPVDISQPQKTRGIHTDYRQLSNQGNQAEFLEDPFNEGDEETSQLTKEMYAVIAGDKLTMLAQAKRSPDWPEWQKSIQEELNMLKEKGTWELIPKPPGVVPISNKWTFVRKWDKQGEI
jgi:hypothetical protein